MAHLRLLVSKHLRRTVKVDCQVFEMDILIFQPLRLKVIFSVMLRVNISIYPLLIEHFFHL